MAIDPCIEQVRTSADGARLVGCAHGGQVLGWVPAGGRERLWLSPTAGCGPGQAIRGGIPVIFPQFAGRGPLPKHGVARDRAWRVLTPDSAGSLNSPDSPDSPDSAESADVDGSAGAATWTAVLADDEATRAHWPHRFELRLGARAGGGTLETALTVRNTGDTAWDFTAALHTYLALGDPGAVVRGLGGRQGEDNAAGGQPLRLGAPGEELAATTARDVAVPAATDPLTLDDPVLGPLVITAEGFEDRVVWNPGPGHGLGDVPAGSESAFVCIEPAVLTAVRLEPGQSWTGRQTLSERAFPKG